MRKLYALERAVRAEDDAPDGVLDAPRRPGPVPLARGERARELRALIAQRFRHPASRSPSPTDLRGR
eukprot:6006112-Pyramimonas_sp.AAC.1